MIIAATTVDPGSPAAPVQSIAIEITNNHVYVPVRAGNRDLWFLLDTGAGITLLNQRVARELKLPLGATFPIRGAGAGELTGAMLELPLRVLPAGDEALALDVAATMPLDHLEPYEGRAIDGVLGRNFLERHVVRIDYADRRLALFDTQAFAYSGGGTRVPFTLKVGHPHITASVQLTSGRRVSGDFIVDVGSSLSVSLTKPFARAHGVAEGLAQAVAVQAGRGVGGAARVQLGRASALHIGDLTVPHPLVALFGDDAGVMSTGEFFDGNLGGALLREFAVTLDYSRSEMILER